MHCKLINLHVSDSSVHTGDCEGNGLKGVESMECQGRRRTTAVGGVAGGGPDLRWGDVESTMPEGPTGVVFWRGSLDSGAPIFVAFGNGLPD